MTTSVQLVQRLGQSIWYDNIRRGLISSGEIERLIGLGVSGLTSNPTIFEKAVAGSTDYDEAVLGFAGAGKGPEEIFEALAIEDIRAAADLLRPIYERTGAADGYASLEVSPRLAHRTEGTIAEARRLFAAMDRPNVMVKVPATPEAIPAIRGLIGDGINVNVTLIFSLDVYRQVQEAYIAGLEHLAESGGDLSTVASVASFFISRVDTAVDGLLEAGIGDGREDHRALLGRAAIANAKLAYREFKAAFGGARFAALRASGAHPQRPLWASTGTKNGSYSDVLYVESLIGPDTVNTVPEATLNAFLDHGEARATIEEDLTGAERALQAAADAGIEMSQVTDKLLSDGLDSFAASFDKLLANVEEKASRLSVQPHRQRGTGLGEHLPGVQAALDDLQGRDVVGRIWRGDHTVWSPDPREISDRLGWLTVTDMMCEQADALQLFADEVMAEGFRDVVLLGMGGSSLGPEVLRQTFGEKPGYPRLAVLDSTVPGSVRALAEAVEPARTLFLVSSKSGTTTEPLSFYRYFRRLVGEASCLADAGRSFVAITDPGTPLEALARREGFRRVFLNPPDLGGRYSVLSYFGLVPAALMGVDLGPLLDRADCMREGCASCVPAHENPGALLGAVLATQATAGRDKLTLVTSPSIGSFGLWAEQLLAESTGKDGNGIVPVAGESMVAPEAYGRDRLFVYLRLDGDDNAATDASLEVLEASGHPVVRLGLRDRYDLGAEFYRWELATAIAGALMGVNPFDQPNVQQAKDATTRILREYQEGGDRPAASPAGSFEDLLSQARPGDYLAIMAYVTQTPETDRALADLRRQVTERRHIATTVGYGPRFLHSTGQLHKGGPNTGLFLQITAANEDDLDIPDEPHTFGMLVDAQATGDLQALRTLGRRVAAVHLETGQVPAIL